MKKILTLVLTLSIILTGGFILTACDDDKALATINRVEIESVEVAKQNSGNFFLFVELDNNTNKSRTFDLSKFKLMLNNEVELEHNGTKVTVKKRDDETFVASITSDQSSLLVGDSITVYYDNDKLTTITISLEDD